MTQFNAQIAGNSISRVQFLKFSRGSMPPDPPSYLKSTIMIRSDFSLDPPLKTCSAISFSYANTSKPVYFPFYNEICKAKAVKWI